MPDSLNDRIHELEKIGNSPQMVSTPMASYLVDRERVQSKAGTWQVIAARNEDSNELVLNRLSIASIIAAAAAVLVFGGASWILARTALQPVNRMRSQADRLVAGGSDDLLSVGEARDELSALATTLNRLISELRASADREKQLVSDASHELRTPLAVMQGELELAELDAGNADALLADLRSSRAAVLRLSSLANNLLELSRIEAATVSGHAGWRELTAELADAIDRARVLSPILDGTESVMIDFDFAPKDATSPGGAAVALSTREFGRILDNLLANAVNATTGGLADDVGDADESKHLASTGATDSGGGTVSAVLERRGESVLLTVTDTGPGMPDEFIPVALDRFTRADNSRAGRPGGGLGLAIVAALVDGAHGTIALANVPGAGLRVTIELPLN
jgi:signal transduction histidine kinase